jgi:hypothetical protein
MEQVKGDGRGEGLSQEMTTYAEKIFFEQKRDQTILSEEDARRDAIAAKTAKLRGLRLAKEAAEREAKVKPKRDETRA